MIDAPWKVSRDGLTVIAEGRGLVICDCRNSVAPVEDRRAHATAIAALPRMLAALRVAERLIGDLPRSRAADEVYGVIADALTAAGFGHVLGGDE